jgi:hypothetical protein
MEEHGGLVLDTDNGELRVRNQRGLDCMARLDEIPSLRDELASQRDELASQRDELASQRITISSLQDRVNSLTMSLDAYKLVASVKVRTSPVTRGSPYVIFTRSQGGWYAIFEPSPRGPYVIFGRSPLWRISE